MKEENDSTNTTDFPRAWIILNLQVKGFSLRSFAKTHGLKPGTVGVVFSRPYPRMERLIGDTLGLAPQEIWPSRYDSAGRPNRRNRWYDRGRRKNNMEGFNVNQKKD